MLYFVLFAIVVVGLAVIVTVQHYLDKRRPRVAEDKGGDSGSPFGTDASRYADSDGGGGFGSD
ncbi:hypothetical protein JIG36_03350 [Actinoplanes sp. LDG1-06]|uniref:Uncharacterized protein n=1 Tax=Paractinoplanes ovalisporus TaxID=2810368 RepID=A0ABS2A415_9ACTN|nr:hypothetical protein [Actinoplanes ovalisporus]MBM2614590.1 hypothetical protein [Actinoplanes ovalisporus]